MEKPKGVDREKFKKSPNQKCGFDIAKNVGTDIELKKFLLILTKVKSSKSLGLLALKKFFLDQKVLPPPRY